MNLAELCAALEVRRVQVAEVLEVSDYWHVTDRCRVFSVWVTLQHSQRSGSRCNVATYCAFSRQHHRV